MITLLLIGLGLCFGSFVNAFVWRLHEGRDWVKERSECLKCHHQLSALDLIPVASWLYLRGKCRYCHTPIPDSPFVELTVPVLFVVSYFAWPLALTGVGLLQFVLWLVFLVAFTALSVYDLKWYLLPDKVVFPLIGLTLVQLVVVTLWTGNVGQGALAVLSAAILTGLFLLLYVVSKGKWIGFGDVKLAIVLGALAGTPLKAMFLLFVASALGSLIALPLVIKGRAGRQTKLPFGPLLIAGTIVAVLWGQTVMDWYIGLLG